MHEALTVGYLMREELMSSLILQFMHISLYYKAKLLLINLTAGKRLEMFSF